MSGMTAIQTDLANIQGNIFGGFNKDHQVFLFLRLTDAARGRNWLAEVVDDVATSEEVTEFNELFKLAKRRHRGREGTVKATWMNLAFTFDGLQTLGVPQTDLDQFPADFTQGMAARAAGIGDIDGNAPDHWIGPLRDADVHLIVLVAADDPDDLERKVTELQDAMDAHGVTLLYRQDGQARSGVDEDNQDQSGHEHFGFDDGVSQPGVRDDRVTRPGIDDDTGLPGQDRLWPGEFVLGYPRQALTPNADGESTDPGEVAVNGPAWTADGSYLVFRRLRQDVAGFREFVADQAATEGIPTAVMGAKIVGRYATGCPLEIVEGQPDGFDTTAKDPSADEASLLTPQRINAFDYASDNPLRDDGDGHRVPRGAHIRKVYPRNQTPVPGEAEAERRRILRRGIAFGASFDPAAAPGDPTAGGAEFPDDRGLLFLCYQRSIEEQFEFLMSAWVNNPDFPQAGDGHDLVIAQRDATRSLTIPDGHQPTITAMQRWVTTTGGGYFFQPSILALRHLCAPAGAADPAC